MNKIGLFWRTVRYLTVRQIIYQIWNRLRKRPRLCLPKSTPKTHFLTLTEADKPTTWQTEAFTFLNQRVSFPHQIDWNYAINGKLWTYHLNYFDFLNQPNVLPDAGLKLIRNFVSQTDSVREGLEAYPTSLRIINWVQFLSRHQIQDNQINAHLFAQTYLVSQRLEHHLAGNHLLENGFALLIGALYFRNDRWFRKASGLIRAELTIQILADGGHDERSPMYHQILLDRLLTILLVLQADTYYNNSLLLPFLTQKATQMLRWLYAVTFRNGDIPMVNDSAFNIAPTTAQLRQKANQIFLTTSMAKKPTENSVLGVRPLSGEESGYRMFRQNRYELFADVGSIGPDHQPGHAHADTFSFVLYVDNQPILVDSGTSTYQAGQQRSWERSTAAHNTVEIAGTNSSEVWAGFRVGRRARVTVMRDTETTLTARHDGYHHLDILCQRSWSAESAILTVTDRLLNAKDELLSGQVGVARFHFHPSINVQTGNDVIIAGPIQLAFKSVTKLNLYVTRYNMAEEFNVLRPAQCLEITFTNTLETTLTLLNENTLSDLLFRT